MWDYLGWKDTLADPRNTARWQAYSKSRGDRERYTPQVVVNGVAHALGSDRSAHREGDRQEPPERSRDVGAGERVARAAIGLTIALPDGAPAAAATVSVLGARQGGDGR